MARAMVTQYGMTERLGAIKLGSGDAEPFLGRDFGHQRDYSEDIAAIVDQEVSKLISNAHQEAFDILTANREVLDDLVRALFEKETLNREEVAAVFQPLAVAEAPGLDGLRRPGPVGDPAGDLATALGQRPERLRQRPDPARARRRRRPAAYRSAPAAGRPAPAARSRQRAVARPDFR